MQSKISASNLEDEPILQGIVISENRQTRTAAHFEAKTRPGARVGATAEDFNEHAMKM